MNIMKFVSLIRIHVFRYKLISCEYSEFVSRLQNVLGIQCDFENFNSSLNYLRVCRLVSIEAKTLNCISSILDDIIFIFNERHDSSL